MLHMSFEHCGLHLSFLVQGTTLYFLQETEVYT